MFKKILSTTATRIVTALISLVVLYLNAKLLGPEGIAVIGVVILGVSLSTLISGLLGSSSLSYFTSRKPLGKLLASSYISIISGAGLLMALHLLLKNSPSLYYRLFLSEELFFHILTLTILQSIYTNHMSVLIGKEKIFIHNVLTLIQFLSLIGILSYLYYNTDAPQVNDYLIAYYTSIILPLLISAFLILKWIINDPIKTTSKGLIKEVWKFGWAVQAASFVQMINYRLPYYFLNTEWNQKNLGVFTTSNQLSEGLWIFGKSVSMVQYARIANSSDTNYNQELTLRLFKFTLFITTIALLLVLLIPSELFVYLLQHEAYGYIPTIILFLAPGILALVAKMILAHYFSGTGRPKINLQASLLSLMVAILSASFLIPHYGIDGAAFSASLTYLTGAVILFILFKKEAKLKFILFLPSKQDVYFIKAFIQEFRKSNK